MSLPDGYRTTFASDEPDDRTNDHEAARRAVAVPASNIQRAG